MIDRDKFYFRTFCVLFWVAATFGFVSQELIPPIEGVWRPFMILIDFLMMVLGLKTLRDKKHIYLVAAFFALVAVSNYFNGLTLVQSLNGCREFFPLLWPLIIVDYLFNSEYADQFRESFKKQLFVFLILQAVCITEQFIRYGANDHGGGSMGNGYTGQASLLIISIIFYIVSSDWDGDNYLQSLWRNRWYFLLLYPILLNETKVSFVMVTVMMLLLYKFEWKSVWKITITLPIAIVAMVGLFQVYLWATGQEDEVGTADYIDEYLVGSDIDIDEMYDIIQSQIEESGPASDDNIIDLPRFLRIALLSVPVEASEGGWLLGTGVGHFKGGTTLEVTEFAKEYEWIYTGSMTQLVMVFMSLGIFGVLWYFLWMKRAIRWKTRAGKMALSRKIFLTAMIILIFFYNDSFRYYPFPVLFYILCCVTIYPRTNDEENIMTDTENVA